MLASGRPVVAAARQGTEVARVVAERGLVVEPENSVAFADAVASLAADAPLRQHLGAAARQYAQRMLDRETVLAGFESALLALSGQGAARGARG